jgi:hypothetical protein
MCSTEDKNRPRNEAALRAMETETAEGDAREEGDLQRTLASLSPGAGIWTSRPDLLIAMLPETERWTQTPMDGGVYFDRPEDEATE